MERSVVQARKAGMEIRQHVRLLKLQGCVTLCRFEGLLLILVRVSWEVALFGVSQALTTYATPRPRKADNMLTQLTGFAEGASR